MSDHHHRWQTIHSHHLGWDNRLVPAHRIEPSTTLEFEILDASGGQLNPRSHLQNLIDLDFSKVNPVTGPIFIEGAEPGDALVVEILEFKTSGWGWTALIPGFGLLADEFPAAHLIVSEHDTRVAHFLPGVARVPIKPFTGVIGVAPAEAGFHSVVPPRRVGGNLDIRDLSAGSTLYLPVDVPGALFSVGDTHAAQGDGEVCGTAIESPMRVVLKFGLEKKRFLPSPQFRTAGAVTRHHDELGYYATTGIAPDLMLAAKDSVRAMIDHLGREYQLEPQDAYALCSVVCDLRISEVVDAPNWVVSCYLPLVVFK
jgi:acetamidase/formamidase